MRLDLHNFESWYELSDRFRAALGLGSFEGDVQPYKGLEHALAEITQTLAQLYPHRRTMAYTGFTGPYFESIAVAFAKEGYKIKSLKPEDVAQPDWVATEAKDVLFVLSTQDDPVTGEIFESTQLVTALQDKKIFHIRLCHGFQRPSLAGTSHFIEILSLNRELAVAIVGERAKFVPPLASRMWWPSWSEAECKTKLLPLAEDFEKHKTTVLEFEKNLPKGFQAYFPNTQSQRLYDRVVFFVEGVDGWAFVEGLNQKGNLELPAPGFHGVAETTSLCRWGNRRIWQWMQQKGTSVDQLRGLIILSPLNLPQL